MSLYFSGAGQTNPPSRDGQLNAAPLAAPAMPVQLESFGASGNTFLPITFAGAAPNLDAGIFEVNFVAPQQSLFNVSLMLGSSNTTFNIAIQQ